MTWVTTLGALISGCGDLSEGQYTPVNLFSEGAGDRVFEQVTYDTVWTYGAHDDSLLVTPFQLEVAPDQDAYVLDIGTQRVHRIGEEDLIWSFGGKGEGPEEFSDARAIAADYSGGVVVVDAGNRRIVRIGPAGALITEAPLPKGVGFLLQGVAPLESSEYVLDAIGQDHRWLLISTSGEVKSMVPTPWEGFRIMDIVQSHGILAGAGGDRWVFGFKVGNGFFVGHGKSVMSAYPFVEHVNFPAVAHVGGVLRHVERPVVAALDLAVSGDTLYVLPGGGSYRFRVVDLYDLNSGGYIGSRGVPGILRAIAVSSDGLFTIDRSGAFPTLNYLRTKKETRK